LAGPQGCGQQPWVAYTLHQILTGQVITNERLKQLDKLRIALDLPSSILQLYKTPWLMDHWGDNDAYFLHRPGAESVPMYEHPYVYRQFTAPTASTLTQA